jgi:hypothetical protein
MSICKTATPHPPVLEGEQQAWRACDMWNWGSRASAPTQQATIHVPGACESFAATQNAFIAARQRRVLVECWHPSTRGSQIRGRQFYPGSHHTLSKQRLKAVAGNIPNSETLHISFFKLTGHNSLQWYWNFFVRVPPDVISLQLCAPKFVVYNSSYVKSIIYS